MRLRFQTLDVFTTDRFGGNPLAVVLDADELLPERMQTIAREFNLSETVFVMRAQNPVHSARVRIFTPRSEIPFAGHPTVGTAILLAEMRTPDVAGEQDALIVLEEPIGTVRVGVRRKPGQAPFAEFDGPKLPEIVGNVAPNELLASALSLLPNEIGFENHRPSCYSAGLPYIFVPVRSRAVIDRAMPVMAQWASAFGAAGAVYVYCRDAVHAGSHFHARMFDPGHGIPEDPATGSAAAAFAGVVLRYDGLPDGTHRRMIEQGFAMGRPSYIALTLEVEHAKLHGLRIGGHAVRVSEGTIAV